VASSSHRMQRGPHVPMKHSGLAFATSIASAVNVLTLGWLLRKRIGEFLDARSGARWPV